MNIKFSTTYFTTRQGNHPGQMKLVAEDVQLDTVNNWAEILLQCDQKEIIDFLKSQGFSVIARMREAISDEYEEHVNLNAEKMEPPITWEEFSGDFN